MREILTIGLSRTNPRGYRAHFERLDPAEQSAYLEALDEDDLPAHLAALDRLATVGLKLRLDGPALDVVVAGRRAPPANGTDGVVDLLARTVRITSRLAGAVVTGLVLAHEPARLEASADLLLRLGFHVTTLTLLDEACPTPGAVDTLEWSVEGTLARFPGGRFWSPAATAADTPATRLHLHRAAARLGARVVTGRD